MKIIRRPVSTINVKCIAEDEPSKYKTMYVRLPTPIAERFERQKTRLACSMNMMARMAIIKFLEEEETIERKAQEGLL